MQEIARTKRLDVAQYFLLGHSYREIEEMTRVSHGTIATVVRELESGRLDLPGIASDQVSDLRQLALDLRKKELSSSQALLGLQFFERCRSSGIALEQLDQWAGLVRVFSSDDLPKEKFFQAALRLRQLEKSQGKPFEVLAEEYERTREHIDQLNDQVDSSVTTKEHLLKEIQPLSLQKDALTKERGDLESQVRLLTKRIDELKPRVAEMEKERSGLAKETGELKRRKAKLSSEVEGKEESLARLNDIGFRDEDLLRLRTIMERTAKKGNGDPEKLKEKVFLALGSFQDLAELDRSREIAEKKLHQIAEKKSLLEGEIVELGNRKAVLLGEVRQAAASVTEEIRGVGEDAVSELRVQVQDIRGSLNTLVADAVRVADAITRMKAEVKKGEETETALTDFIAEVKAGLGRSDGR